MTELLVSLVVVALLTTLGLAALSALTVLPFVVTLDVAERRGWGTARWGVLQVLASLIGLALLALRARDGVGSAAVAGVVALAVAWLPTLLARVVPDRSALVGARGRHEQGG